MALRVRFQQFKPGKKKASVEIISVDQFTRRARLLDKSKTERGHLLLLLSRPVGGEVTYTITGRDKSSTCCWLEKP
jgi:hypothetical protein